MSTKLNLTTTQRQILGHAITHTQGHVRWFPDSVRGGARQKVLDGLHSKGLIYQASSDHWIVTVEGYQATGLSDLIPQENDKRLDKKEIPQTHHAELSSASDDEPATSTYEPAALPRTREHSKQAQVIALLKRPEGATIAQIRELTGWQAHTIRGTFSGAFRKKLGLTLASEKAPQGERVYRLG